MVRALYAAGGCGPTGRAVSRYYRRGASVRRRGSFSSRSRKRLAAQGLRAHIGIADTVGAAWAVARYGKAPLVVSGKIHEALASLPLAALRLSPETRDDLFQLGLKAIGDVMSRPRGPLTARFGSDLIRRLDQALGCEEEPITPRTPILPLSVEQGFAQPLLRDEDLLSVLARLGEQLCGLLEKRGEGARQMLGSLFGVDGVVKRLQIGTSRPLRDGAHIHRLVADKFRLAKWENEFGFDRIRFAVLETESFALSQKHLGAGKDGPELSHLIDRLAARLGAHRVFRLMLQDDHVPEQACVAVPATAAKEFLPPISPEIPVQDNPDVEPVWAGSTDPNTAVVNGAAVPAMPNAMTSTAGKTTAQ